MPDFAPNYTARIRIKYRAAGANHSQLFRVVDEGAGGSGLTGLLGTIQDYYDAIGPTMYDDWTVLACDAAGVDSDIFLPVSPAPTTSGAIAFGPGILAAQKAVTISFVGRSTSGLRWVLYQYGYAVDPGSEDGSADFRLLGTEDATILAAIAALNGSGFLCANDGHPVAVYPYANTKYNDYWTGKVRRGT